MSAFGRRTNLRGALLQDKISFVRSLWQEVIHLVETTISVLDSAYRDFHDFPVDPESTDALEKSIKRYDSRAFSE